MSSCAPDSDWDLRSMTTELKGVYMKGFSWIYLYAGFVSYLLGVIRGGIIKGRPMFRKRGFIGYAGFGTLSIEFF